MYRRGFLALLGVSTSSGCLSRALSRTTTSQSCPPFPSETQQRAGQTICDGNQGGAPVYLDAKRETVAATDGRIRFAFVNTTDTAVSYGPCFWTLYEKTADGWRTVHPVSGDALGKLLPAHGSHELTLNVGQQDTTATDCPPYRVSALDSGRYLFGIQGETPDGTTTLFLASFRATS